MMLAKYIFDNSNVSYMRKLSFSCFHFSATYQKCRSLVPTYHVYRTFRNVDECKYTGSKKSLLMKHKLCCFSEYKPASVFLHAPYCNQSTGTDSPDSASEKCSQKNTLKHYESQPWSQFIWRYLPPKLGAYLQIMRFDKPIGTFLLYWPCTWGISLAAQPHSFPDLYLLGLFLLGAVCLRGAGCVINDMWDRELDKRVQRTKQRPLASGALDSFDALVILGMQLGLGCLVLLQLNSACLLMGSSSLSLVMLYPLMKRITFWPQLMLGFTFNWGVLLGYTAVNGTLNVATCLPLYAAGVCWTIVYDTIYAHQDKLDDISVGVKSTALKFGDDTKRWLLGFSCAMWANLLLTGYVSHLAWPFYATLLGVAAFMSKQLYSVDLNNCRDCHIKFCNNRHVGLLIFMGIVMGVLFKSDAIEEQSL